ncbi:MAG: hypothetical protein WCB77_21750, partial [Pseudolabrys sp.]
QKAGRDTSSRAPLTDFQPRDVRYWYKADIAEVQCTRLLLTQSRHDDPRRGFVQQNVMAYAS